MRRTSFCFSDANMPFSNTHICVFADQLHTAYTSRKRTPQPGRAIAAAAELSCSDTPFSYAMLLFFI